MDEEAQFEGDPGEECVLCVPVHGKWPIQGFCDPGVKDPISGAFAKARKIFVTAGRGEVCADYQIRVPGSNDPRWRGIFEEGRGSVL